MKERNPMMIPALKVAAVQPLAVDPHLFSEAAARIAELEAEVERLGKRWRGLEVNTISALRVLKLNRSCAEPNSLALIDHVISELEKATPPGGTEEK